MARWDLQTVHGDVEIFCRNLRVRQAVRRFRRHPIRVLAGLLLGIGLLLRRRS